MSKVKIKFNEAGRWAEMDVNEPQFEVKADEEKEVSLELGEFLVNEGHGTRVNESKSETVSENKTDKVEKDSGSSKKNKGKKGK